MSGWSVIREGVFAVNGRGGGIPKIRNSIATKRFSTIGVHSSPEEKAHVVNIPAICERKIHGKK